jgi:hypothetical protein
LPRRCLPAALAFVLMAGAHAHDTWFDPAPPAADDGRIHVRLGTGEQFPGMETGMRFDALRAGGCRVGAAGASPIPWQRERETPQALHLRSARSLPSEVPISCHGEFGPFDLDMDLSKVELYFKEIQAGPAIRARWAGIKAGGKPWIERYAKFARIEWRLPAAGFTLPSGLGLDAVMQVEDSPLRAGGKVRFQVLRDGQPLAGLPVELRSDASPIGFWRRTDAEGRVETVLPLAGRWLLRGTDLRPAVGRADAWDSRFLALTFEVGR